MLRDAQPFGGKQRYVKETLALWTRYGHKAVVLSMDQAIQAWGIPARLLPRLAVNAASLFHRLAAAAARLYNFSVAKLDKWLAAEQFDVAHLHDHAHFSIALLDVLERAGLPAVYTVHDYQLLCPVSVLFREHERRMCEACRGGRFWNAVRYRCSHGRIANSLVSAADTWLHASANIQARIQRFITSSRAALYTFQRFGWRRARFEYLPHFVSSRVGFSSERASAGIARILCVARLWDQKGVHVLLEAAARLKSQRVEITIVGDGPRLSALQAQADKLGLSNVRFLGQLDDVAVRQTYSSAICVAVPSIWPEVFGLVVLEAFAAHRPVVASNVGGLAELVDDGADGWLVPPGDVDALADRLDWMLSHPAEALKMGEAGYRKATTIYTPERHYQGLREIYDQAIKEHGQRC